MKHILTALCSLLVWHLAQAQTQKDFYATDQIIDIRIRTNSPNWENTLDSLRLYGDGTITVSAKIGTDTYDEVGMRYAERTGFQLGKHRNALELLLDEFKEQSHQGIRHIHLSEALRDPSMVREVYGYELANTYMHAPDANYARVYINDAYYGLLVNVEAIDSVFLNKEFGSSDGLLIHGAPLIDVESDKACKQGLFASLQLDNSTECYQPYYRIESGDSTQQYDRFLALLNNLADKNSDIASILDVNQTLWMLAYNNVLVNFKSYSGAKSRSYYLYLKPDGRWLPIITDINLNFGSLKSWRQGHSDLDLKDLQRFGPLADADYALKPLMYRLLQDDQYRKMYLANIRTIVDNHFNNKSYIERIGVLQASIKSDFVRDPNQYYKELDFLNSLYETTGKVSKIPGIEELMNKRVKFLRSSSDLSDYPPTLKEASFAERALMGATRMNSFDLSIIASKYPSKATVFYRFNKEDSWASKDMMIDADVSTNRRDKKAFFVSIPAPNEEAVMEYYLFIENIGAGRFYPATYTLQPYDVSLRSLNQ